MASNSEEVMKTPELEGNTVWIFIYDLQGNMTGKAKYKYEGSW